MTKHESTGCALAAVVIGAASLLDAGPSHADPSTAREIRELKAEIRALEHRFDAKARRERQAKSAPGSNARVIKGDEPALYPDRFYFKGVTIMPGGYIAFDSVYRSRWLGNDIAISYNTIPFGNSPQANLNEFRFSARTSRPSLRVDGDVNATTRLRGYLEMDFLGAAQTANSNQTNSYNPRIRHLYSTADFNDIGLHVLAGQTWTLGTTNSLGISPDTALTPPQINSQQIPGFTYPRQPQFRVAEQFNKEFAAAFSVESPATTTQALGPATWGTTGVISPGGAVGVPLVSAAPFGGGNFNSANVYSFNRLPDFIAKAAWDPTVFDRHVHVEGFGLLRDFTDRMYWGDHSVWGGGAGGAVVVEVMPKLLDFQASGMTGYGVGRYGASNLPDITTSITGAPLPIHERFALVGLTLHATPQTDLYVFAGGEYQSAKSQFGVVGKTLIVGGIGNYLYNNLGCEIEPPSAYGLTNPASLNTTCAGQTKDVREITGGFWQTIYAGPFGKLKAGVQYAFTQRDGFQGVGGSPRGVENSVYTSFRYYPF